MEPYSTSLITCLFVSEIDMDGDSMAPIVGVLQVNGTITTTCGQQCVFSSCCISKKNRRFLVMLMYLLLNRWTYFLFSMLVFVHAEVTKSLSSTFAFFHRAEGTNKSSANIGCIPCIDAAINTGNITLIGSCGRGCTVYPSILSIDLVGVSTGTYRISGHVLQDISCEVNVFALPQRNQRRWWLLVVLLQICHFCLAVSLGTLYLASVRVILSLLCEQQPPFFIHVYSNALVFRSLHTLHGLDHQLIGWLVPCILLYTGNSIRSITDALFWIMPLLAIFPVLQKEQKNISCGCISNYIFSSYGN